MGTWAAGPFGNDSALDYVGSVVDGLMDTLDTFVACPQIDENFDEAFTALALLNEVMTRTPSRPWDHAAKAVKDPEPVVGALIRCFDEQIDGLVPDPDFKTAQRAALVTECARFSALMAR